MLSRLKIRTKILLMIGVMMAGMALASGVALYNLRAAILAEKEVEVRNMVQAAVSVAASFHARAAKGEMTEEQARTLALDTLRPLRYGPLNDYVFVYRMDGTSLAIGPRPQDEGKPRLDALDAAGKPYIRAMIEAARSGGGFVPYVVAREGFAQPQPKLSYAAAFAPWGWMLGTGVYIDDVDGTFLRNAAQIAGLGALLVVVSLVAAHLIARDVTRPLAALGRNMVRIADGDLSVEIVHHDRGDEVGVMATALKTFRQRAEEQRRLEAEARTETERRLARQQRLDGLSRGFDSAVQGLLASVQGALETLTAASGDLSATAAQTQSLTTSVSSATHQSSSNVETVAAAAGQLTASINDIERQVVQAADISRAARAQAESANERIGRLAEAGRHIGDVVKLISDIASQTNLLALNATIEAARAGEAGKGFAVVAGEVKTLASQTARATEEITQQIAAVQEQTDGAVAAIREVGDVIARLSGLATAIAGAVEEQGTATQEIVRNVQEAATGARQITSDIGEVREGAERTTAMARTVAGAADRLNDESRSLQGEVRRFLQAVQEA